MNDMFSTMIKLVKAEWSSIEDYVWYRFAIGVHKYEKKKLWWSYQGGFALIKVELFQKERKLVDRIWVKVEIVGKVPQILMLIRKTNWVSLMKKEN